MLIALDHRILVANDRASELFGWEGTGLAGQLLDVLVPESVAAAHRDWSDDYFNRPVARIMGEKPRLEGVRRNGERIQLDISLSPVKVQDENLVLVVARNLAAISARLAIPLNELSALSEIARLVTGPMEAAEVFPRMARQIRTLLPYDQLLLCAIDRNNPVLRHLYTDGQEVAQHQPGSTADLNRDQAADLRSMTKPTTFAGRAAPRWFAEMVEGPGGTGDGLNSILSAPLRWNGEVIGTLNLRSKNDSAYGEESLKLAEQIATSLAAVVARSRSSIIEAEATDHRATMASIGRLIGDAADIGPVVDSLATQIDQLIPLDRLTLLRVDVDRGRCSVEAEWGLNGPKMMPGVSQDLSGTGAEKAVLAGAPVIFTDEQIRSVNLYQRSGDSTPDRTRSWLSAPLKLGGRLVGVVHFRSEQPDVYQPSHLDFAQEIAAQVAGAFGDPNAIQDHERERRVRKSVVSLTRGVVRGDRLEEMAEAARDHLSKFVEFDRFAAVAIDQDRANSVIVYESGVTLAGPDPGNAFPYNGVASGTEPRIGTKAEDSLMWGEELAGAGLQSWMYTTINGRSGLPVGAVWVGARRQRAFGERDLETFERLTSVMVPEFHGFAQEIARQHLARERERSNDLSHQTEVLEFEARAKSEFIGSITHEFKSPLTSVVAFSNLLSHDPDLTERQLKHIGLIQSSAVRLEKMIDDLLDVARANAGKLSFNISEVHVSEVVREVCDGLRPVASDAGRRLFYNCPESPVTAAVDPLRVAQAIQNLVSNAIKYSPVGTAITVSTNEQDDRFTVNVRNRGQLTKKQTADAFVRFNRLDNEITRGTPGTGLGLAISRQVIEEMGGTVTLESSTGSVEASLSVPILNA